MENGYIIALLTEDGIRSEWVNREIELAREFDKAHLSVRKSIIPIVIGETIPKKYLDLQCIKLSSDTEELYDEVVDAILKTILSSGEILTYCRNFKNGINHSIDIDEADRLGRLFYNFAVERDNANSPTGAICLGICYEEGIGVRQDLQKAYYLFSDPVATDGLAIEMAKRVYQKMLTEQSLINTPKESILKRFIQKIKKFDK